MCFHLLLNNNINWYYSVPNYIWCLAPVPSSVQTILGTVCKDIPGSHNDTTKWLYSRGAGQCKTITHNDIDGHDLKMANQIVFVFQVGLQTQQLYRLIESAFGKQNSLKINCAFRQWQNGLENRILKTCPPHCSEMLIGYDIRIDYPKYALPQENHWDMFSA